MAQRSPSIICRGLLLLFTCLSWGTVNSPTQKVRHEFGIVGDSIPLSLSNMPGKNSYLQFQFPSGEWQQLAAFKNGKWKRTKSNDRFGHRLVMVNETMLRITDLEKEDSGLFKFNVKLPDFMSQDFIFNLTVYAPVPKPRILNVSNTSDQCNITLWCLVDGEERYNISWEKEGTLNGSWDSHQFSDNSSTVHLLWEPERSNFNVTCVVSNPVDRNNASFDPPKSCPQKAPRNEHNETKGLNPLISMGIAILVITILAIACVTYCRWTKRTKHKEGSGERFIAACVQSLEEQERILPNSEERAESGSGELSAAASVQGSEEHLLFLPSSEKRAESVPAGRLEQRDPDGISITS